VYRMREMFRGATSYNQDLSSWSVDGVVDCYFFNWGATSWAQQYYPIFTNCTP